MKHRITAALAALAFALIGLVGLAPSASAAATDCTSWHSASWGRGQICYDADSPWGGGAYDLRMGVDDIDPPADGYCVYLWRQTAGGSWGNFGSAYASCGPINYSYWDTYPTHQAAWRITRGPTMTNWVTICNDFTGSPGQCPPR